jgi:multidrug resistance efflux pump
MSSLRKNSVLGVGIAAVAFVGLAVLVGVLFLTQAGAGARADEAGASPDPGENVIPVKTVRPKRDPSFNVSIEQPAFVDGYYKADLMARVAGPIKRNGIVNGIGDRVKADDVLAQIDVPDLEQDLHQREAVIEQRLSDLTLAQANLKTARAAEKAAGELVNVRQEEVGRAEASERFRQKELARFTRLASGPDAAVTADVIDEATERYEEAKAGSAAARAAVKGAEAELEKARAKSEASAADVKVAESLVGVARKDRDKAQAMLNLATIRAPFDGVITRRNADPGTFVQNAATAHTEPLLTLVRDDIVTVFMKVPDRYAPYVNRDTEAVIQMDTLPGRVIRGKVTRYAPSLDNPEHDRTMRVEVDLYNGTGQQYQAFVAEEKASGGADLKSRILPQFPRVEGKDPADQQLGLMPGQYGKMRLVLRSFKDAWLLPRTAVISQGGTSYVFLVKDGRALKMPVAVQADSGEEVKVALIEKVGGETVQHGLTGNEEVVSTNQGELSNGQAVKTTRVEW